MIGEVIALVIGFAAGLWLRRRAPPPWARPAPMSAPPVGPRRSWSRPVSLPLPGDGAQRS